jgi:hypothetical protein
MQLVHWKKTGSFNVQAAIKYDTIEYRLSYFQAIYIDDDSLVPRQYLERVVIHAKLISF